MNRLADLISRTTILEIFKEKNVKFQQEETRACTSINSRKQELSPLQNAWRIRAEMLFDMNSQLLLRKDLPYAEPEVVSHLQNALDVCYRRRRMTGVSVCQLY